MKTRTYLRLSLLTPFLVWGVCVLFFIILSTFESNGSESMGSSVVVGLVFWVVLFYVFGIVGWFLPYVLLSLLLLIWSFRSRTQVLMKGFALSPFAMTILIVIFVNMLSIGTGGWDMFSSNSAENFENFFVSNLLFGILALIWGYICIGLGFGIYKSSQRLGFIRDEANTGSVTLIPAPL
jgi:hypothetical protein